MKKADEPGKNMYYCLLFASNVQRGLTVIFAPSVLSYFLWSCLLYICCGGVLYWGSTAVENFFCAVAPQTQLGGVGCTNCPSTSLTCSKSACYRSAMNITLKEDASTSGDPLYQDFMEASTDLACNGLLESADDPVRMVVAISANKDSVTEGCKKFHCRVLKNALGANSDLNSALGTCTNSYGTKSSSDASTCLCSGLLTGAWPASDIAGVQTLCGNLLDPLCSSGSVRPSWCPTTTTLAATTAASSSTAGAVSRRLEGMPGSPEVMSLTAGGAPAGGIFLQETLRQRCDGDKKQVAREQMVPGDLLQIVPSAIEVPAMENMSHPRLLQGASTSAPTSNGASNEQLQDWTVNAWSQCTCYQQCVPGVKKRLVQCLAAKCKDPMPPTKATCRCSHCAVCDVSMSMLVLMICFFVQSAVALIIFGCYAFVSRLDEENLIKLGIGKRLIGFFSKHLPPLVRFIMLASFIQIVILLVETFVPAIFRLDWMRDCFASSAMRVVSLVIAGLWLAQLILGRCAKRFTRKPPWLYVPERASWPTPLKQIGQLVRCLGP